MQKNCRLISTLLIVLLLFLPIAPGLAEEEEDWGETGVAYWNGESWAIPEGVEDLGGLVPIDAWMLDRLELPSSLRRIRDEALYNLGVSSLHIPEGVEVMDSFCLEYASIRRLTLPSTLREFSARSVDGQVEHVRIAEDNPYFKVVDDVVFTKDGTTLVYYPERRQGQHYTVPAGVTTIGKGAISENDNLVSLTLPMGVKVIEDSGIRSCGRLERVSLPLSLESIGSYCFLDCVSLQQAAVPSGTVLGERCFENCPWLGGIEPISSPAYEREERWNSALSGDALLSPDSARDMVPIYERPDTHSKVLARGGCGSYVNVQEVVGDFLQVCWYSDVSSEASSLGYVLADQAVRTDAWRPLFEIERVVPKKHLTGSLSEMRILPTEVTRRAWPEGALIYSVSEVCGQWLEGYWIGHDPEMDGEIGTIGSWSYELWAGDLDACYRVWTGDDKVFGMVISDAPENRVNLREQPKTGAHHLAKYFAGTQLEVLGEDGDWYQVRMNDGTEGWMMKKFVMIIEQEAF